MNKKIIYTKKDEKSRLDVFLTQTLGKTRSQVKKLILADLILVNNKPARVHEFLKFNDQIEILPITPQTAPRNQTTTKNIEKPTLPTPKNWLQKIFSFCKKNIPQTFVQEPKVLIETNDYLILEKPAGMLVHPTLKNENHTLVDWLLQKFPKIKGVGEDPARPGLIHRLDKDVSGLMVIAKNLDFFDHLKKQFKLRTIKKYYLALVHDHIQKDSGSIDFNITRAKSGKYVALPIGVNEGKDAHTEFEVMKRFNHYTLVKIRILTGRTNQIRIHFNALGHPLVGDELYFSKKINPKHKIILNRVFLHANFLSFIDLNNKEQKFESPLPERLQNLLMRLK